MTLSILGRLFVGRASVQARCPGRSTSRSSRARRRGTGAIPFVALMAAISLQLGIFNLLPIPVLDGGHLFLLGARGRRPARLLAARQGADPAGRLPDDPGAPDGRPLQRRRQEPARPLVAVLSARSAMPAISDSNGAALEGPSPPASRCSSSCSFWPSWRCARPESAPVDCGERRAQGPRSCRSSRTARSRRRRGASCEPRSARSWPSFRVPRRRPGAARGRARPAREPDADDALAGRERPRLGPRRRARARRSGSRRRPRGRRASRARAVESDRRLLAEGAIPRATFEADEAASVAAQGRMRAGGGPPRVPRRLARGARRGIVAGALARAPSSLTVRAPADGVVFNLPRRVGESVEEGHLVASVSDPDRLRVRVRVDQPDLPRVARGAAAGGHLRRAAGPPVERTGHARLAGAARGGRATGRRSARRDRRSRPRSCRRTPRSTCRSSWRRRRARSSCRAAPSAATASAGSSGSLSDGRARRRDVTVGLVGAERGGDHRRPRGRASRCSCPERVPLSEGLRVAAR